MPAFPEGIALPQKAALPAPLPLLRTAPGKTGLPMPLLSPKDTQAAQNFARGKEGARGVPLPQGLS